MYIGQLNLPTRQTFFSADSGIFGTQRSVPFAAKQSVTARYDRVEIGRRDQSSAGIAAYRPNQMQTLKVPEAAAAFADDEMLASLSRELLPPSERGEYTEKDALLNQYSKQFRLENSGGRLMGEVTDEQLEQFRNELVANGLGEEIDWKGVETDFIQMRVNFDNAQRFEQKADYLASRYAILKDRIQTQYTGEKQESEMQKLEQIYSAAKEEMANAYADSIGNFYEGLGQTGTAADMRESVLAAIDGKADEYSAYLAENDIYGAITDPEKQWLKQDDGYMAAQLRESVSAAREESRPTAVREQAAYSSTDLQYAGVFAKELSHMLQRTEKDGVTVFKNWNASSPDGDDAGLGKEFAELFSSVYEKTDSTGVSDKTLDLIKDSIVPYITKFMDVLDRQIDIKGARPGLFRTEHIDRDQVFSAFDKYFKAAD